MKAKFAIVATVELADPDDYPLDVDSWEAAAHAEYSKLSVEHEDGIEVLWDLAVQGPIELVSSQGSDEPFRRTEGDE